MRVAIVNVTGYAGVELARLLLRHPEVQLVQVTGRGQAGQRLVDVFPHLGPIDLVIEPEITASVDVVFSALPHKASAEIAPSVLESGAKFIDISADFRLRDPATYEQWYKVSHPCPELLDEAVYGLPELHREAIRGARLIANPGCYPTSAILALSPVMDIVEPDIIVDSKSGVSGAGRTLSLTHHYSEANESCQAYGLAGHRHMPEIAQELAAQRALRLASDDGVPLALTFVPHLIPMTRGILSTCYARLRQACTIEELRERYRSAYADAPFTRLSEQPPQTKQTWGSNYCLIYPTLDARTGRLIVVACLDNLVKGAAGQAIENMNLMCGFDQRAGLAALPVYP
jgi:N-acetyl-gamma-glutamyl-phosphate reductase